MSCIFNFECFGSHLLLTSPNVGLFERMQPLWSSALVCMRRFFFSGAYLSSSIQEASQFVGGEIRLGIQVEGRLRDEDNSQTDPARANYSAMFCTLLFLFLENLDSLIFHLIIRFVLIHCI